MDSAPLGLNFDDTPSTASDNSANTTTITLTEPHPNTESFAGIESYLQRLHAVQLEEDHEDWNPPPWSMDEVTMPVEEDLEEEEEEEELVEEESTASTYHTCSCKSASVLGEGDYMGPSPSDILVDTLVHHELYDESEDAVTFKETETTSEEMDTEGSENKLNPFTLKWCIGFNFQIPILNLTYKMRKEIFMAASHKGVLFDYEKRNMRYINGHVNPIRATAVEETGRWVATSDFGPNSCIIITETTNCLPVRTICHTSEDDSAVIIALSPDGKYMVTIHGTEKTVIKFWLWTYGQEEPNDVFDQTKKFWGKPRKIAFQPNNFEYLMIAYEREILFMHWSYDREKLVQVRIAQVQRNFGTFTDCTLALNCHECFASSMDGSILIFGSALYKEYFGEHPVDNNKAFVKAIRITRNAITFLSSVEQVLVCIDSKGYVRFFDREVKLLYWISHKHNLHIINVSFHLGKRDYLFEDPFNFDNDFFTLGNISHYIEAQPEDRVDNYEVLFRNMVPSEASLERSPFIIKQFIAACENGNIYLIDLVNDKYEQLFYPVDSPVADIDCSDEKNALVIAYENGRVSMFDYTSLRQIATNTRLVRTSDAEKVITNTVIRYSPASIHLGFGRSNGDIWFLNELLEAYHTAPYNYTSHRICKICFSFDLVYCAFYDSNKTVFLLNYMKKGRWYFLFKFRSHYKEITDLMFTETTPTRLYSIGRDRYLVEYNLDDPDNPIQQRIRIEQFSTPLAFVYYPGELQGDNYLLIANDQQKFKYLHEETKTCRSVALGPSYGCYGTFPVLRMAVLPTLENTVSTPTNYLIFMNKDHLGIQKLPADGNPYKYVGVLAHNQLLHFALGCRGRYAFTCGQNDPVTFLWEVNKKAVEYLQQMGGPELDPYSCLIHGGINGWYFKEMQDLFCYMQILHQGDFYEPQQFGDTIAVSELPDLMRSCGYYPSDFEVEIIMNDIKYNIMSKEKPVARDECSFLEFIKLYINHRRAFGIVKEELENNFRNLYRYDYGWINDSINKDTFIDNLCIYGESLPRATIEKSLQVLTQKILTSESKRSLDQPTSINLPQMVNFEVLSKDVLGILQDSVYAETQEKQFKLQQQQDMM